MDVSHMDGSLCVGTNRDDDDDDLSTSSHKIPSQEKQETKDSWTHKFNNSLYGEANYPLGMLLLYVIVLYVNMLTETICSQKLNPHKRKQEILGHTSSTTPCMVKPTTH